MRVLVVSLVFVWTAPVSATAVLLPPYSSLRIGAYPNSGTLFKRHGDLYLGLYCSCATQYFLVAEPGDVLHRISTTTTRRSYSQSRGSRTHHKATERLSDPSVRRATKRSRTLQGQSRTIHADCAVKDFNVEDTGFWRNHHTSTSVFLNTKLANSTSCSSSQSHSSYKDMGADIPKFDLEKVFCALGGQTPHHCRRWNDNPPLVRRL